MVGAEDIVNDSLEKQGWQRRSILDEPRLGEVVAMYEELGLEVKVVDLDPELYEGCIECARDQEKTLKVVYTRNKSGEG